MYINTRTHRLFMIRVNIISSLMSIVFVIINKEGTKNTSRINISL